MIGADSAFESSIDWPGMRSELSWLPPSDRATFTRPWQVGVSFSAHRGLGFEQAGRSRSMDVEAGSVFVTAGDGITWSRVRELTDALEIYPDLGLVHRLAAEAGVRSFDVTPACGVRDAVVLGIAAKLKRAHLGSSFSDIDASTLAHRLSAHLLQAYAGVRVARGGPTERIAPQIIERVRDFAEAHLDERLTLEQLAGVAGFSAWHFARVFKRTTGLAPRQFITMLRVERAKLLLLETADSVRAVAYAVGFTNLHHFRRQFRAHFGVLPIALRARTDPLQPARVLACRA
jgi:AraC family transcriptional regulator